MHLLVLDSEAFVQLMSNNDFDYDEDSRIAINYTLPACGSTSLKYDNLYC